MKEVKLKFDWKRLNVTPFKEKDAKILSCILSSGGYMKDMSFDGFGNIKFETKDVTRENPIITDIGKEFKRGNSCLVFTLKETNKNPGIFTNMMIFQSIGKQINNYGVLFYNIKENTQTGKYFCSYDLTDFLNSINVYLYDIKQSDYIKKYINRYKHE